MESNECICYNFLAKQLETLMTSLANTIQGIQMNRNSPSTDSGFYQPESLQTTANSINTSFLSGFGLNSTVLSLMLIAIIFGFLNSGKKQTKK